MIFTVLSSYVSSSVWTTHWATNGSISRFHFERLHHQTLYNLFSNRIFEAHHAQILLCFSLGVGVWLIIQQVFWTFWLFSLVFSTTFWVWFGLPIPQLHVSFDVCAYIPLTLWISPSHVALMVTNTWGPICSLWHLCCYCARWWLPRGMKTTTCVSFNHIHFLSSTSWHSAH